MIEREYFTVKQASEIFGVSPMTVYLWINTKKIRAKEWTNIRPGNTDVNQYKIKRIHIKEIDRVKKLRDSGLPI